jgi:preprotein translocase subunit YajC
MMHVNSFSGLLAFAGLLADGGTSGPQPNAVQSLIGSPLIMIVLMGVMFYFLLFRPQQQRAKQQAKLLAALKPGDKVVTASGIVGTIITLKDNTVTLRSADSKFEVTKASVTDVIPAESTPATAS